MGTVTVAVTGPPILYRYRSRLQAVFKRIKDAPICQQSYRSVVSSRYDLNAHELAVLGFDTDLPLHPGVIVYDLIHEDSVPARDPSRL